MPASRSFPKPEPEPEDELVIYVELERELTTEEQTILDWRRKQLRHAGFKPHWADLIAADHNIDYTKAIRMLEQGCRQRLIHALLSQSGETP